MQKVFNQNLAAESSPLNKYLIPSLSAPQGSKFTVLRKIGEGVSSEVFLIEEDRLHPASKISFDSAEMDCSCESEEEKGSGRE
jgi:hypothetical protein